MYQMSNLIRRYVATAVSVWYFKVDIEVLSLLLQYICEVTTTNNLESF